MRKNLVVLIEDDRLVVGAPGDTTPTEIRLSGRWSEQTAERLGAMLTEGLGATRLAVGRVVVGVPVSWVLTQHLTVPSVDPAVTAGAVRMRVGRDYATDAGDLIADYTSARRDAGSDVLIGVTMRGKVRCLTEAFEHAGLKVEAIHITAQAFAESGLSDATVVRLHPPTAELALVRGGRTIGLRSLTEAVAGDDIGGTARAISSAIVSDPQLSGAGGEMVLVSDASSGVDLGAVVTQLNGVTRGGARVVDESAIEALRRRAGDEDMIDLLRCRASGVVTQAWTASRKMIVAAAVVALMVVVFVGGMWWSRERRLTTLEATSAQMKPEAEALGEVKGRLDTSAPWFDKRVDTLACMHALTECIPKRGELWLAEYHMNADQSGSLRGRAESRGVMLAFLRALEASDGLTDVALRDSAVSQDGDRHVRFEITYRFTGMGGAR